MDIKKFQKTILKGQEIPKNLEILLTNKCALAILEKHNFELLNELSLQEELSHSYLNDNDKKNLDIMANVKAIDDVFKRITFFATSNARFNSVTIGYWCENEETSILNAPLVTYNSEGEFSLLYDYNIIESLLAEITMEDEDEYEEYKTLFSKCDITLKEIWDLEIKKPNVLPQDLHHKLYNEYRKEFGLESIN